MLFGVAGGMARYFDLDPSVVRVVWALLVLAGGAGLLLYIVAAIVIPEEPVGWATMGTAGNATDATGATGAPGTIGGDAATTEGGPAAQGSAPRSGPPWGYHAGVNRRERGGGAVILGIALVVLGAWFLLRRFIPQIDADIVWPVVLLVLGGLLVLGAMRRRP